MVVAARKSEPAIQPAAFHPPGLLAARTYDRIRPAYAQAMAEHRALRRICVGDDLTLLFESWDTVLFQVHEVLRVEGRSNEARAQREFDEYARLAPRPGSVAATAFVDGGSCATAVRLAAAIANVPGTLFLACGAMRVDGYCIEDDLGDAEPVRYVRFDIGVAMARAALAFGICFEVGLKFEGCNVRVPLDLERSAAIARDVGGARPSPPLAVEMAAHIGHR